MPAPNADTRKTSDASEMKPGGRGCTRLTEAMEVPIDTVDVEVVLYPIVQGEAYPNEGCRNQLGEGPSSSGRISWRLALLSEEPPKCTLRGRPPETEPPRLIVKRLLPHFPSHPEGRTMFEREAALHTSVQHENVVQVFGSAR